jgi:hypothetical protein
VSYEILKSIGLGQCLKLPLLYSEDPAWYGFGWEHPVRERLFPWRCNDQDDLLCLLTKAEIDPVIF